MRPEISKAGFELPPYMGDTYRLTEIRKRRPSQDQQLAWMRTAGGPGGTGAAVVAAAEDAAGAGAADAVAKRPPAVDVWRGPAAAGARFSLAGFTLASMAVDDGHEDGCLGPHAWSYVAAAASAAFKTVL
jgi:hypothetical protein